MMIRRDKTKITTKHFGMLNGQIVLSCFKMLHVTQSISWHQETRWFGILKSSCWVYCLRPIWGYVQKNATCKILKIHRSFHFQDPWNRCYFGWLVSCTHPLTNSWFHPSRCLQDISPRVGTDVSLFLNMGVRHKKKSKDFPMKKLT